MTTAHKKVAVVTGASQGIGAGLVAAYREAGYAVVANSRHIAFEEAENLAVVAGDIGDPAVARIVVDTACQRFGRLDTLVNNAGIFIGKPFTDYTREDFDKAVHVNLGGFFHVTQQALVPMLEQRSGHVVQVTASLVEHAKAAIPAGLAALTKGGLAAVTRGLAIEYAEQGIRVNAVSPGVIRTPLHEGDDYEALAGIHPMNKVGEVADIVAGVMYLENAGFTTGETLHLDGGWHAGS